MACLSEERRETLRQYVYGRWGTCYNCMPWDKGPVWIVEKCELDDAIQEALEDTGIDEELPFDPADYTEEIIEELGLHCPTCGTRWDSPAVAIGTSAKRRIELSVPPINDTPGDFDILFDLWDKANDYNVLVKFDLSKCDFLRPNAVAFLGGLARLVESRYGSATFDWNSLTAPAVMANLRQNGFAGKFGDPSSPWSGNSIPYREDLKEDANGYWAYLENDWLGRGWVRVSGRLRDSIVRNMWEIYNNAFEHAGSPFGVFSCGQYFQNKRILLLSIVDFGKGIAANVRGFLRSRDDRAEQLTAAGCLRWAFGPGHTTRPNQIGGNGLDLLKEFIKINHGRLEVYSHEGYALIEANDERFVNRSGYFEGTIFHITLQCDERYYQFADENDAD